MKLKLSNEAINRISLYIPDPECIHLGYGNDCRTGARRVVYLRENKNNDRLTPEMEEIKDKVINESLEAGLSCPFSGEPDQTETSQCSNYYPKRGKGPK